MKQHVIEKVKLDPDERNLLSVAYKNVVGSKRSAWRVTKSVMFKEKDEAKKQVYKDYLERILKEIQATCDEVLVRNYKVKLL